MPGSKPGERRGGRKAGTPNKATAAREAEIKAEGLTPLDYMLEVLRNAEETPANRMWAAEKAAPYVHPKLASVEHMGEGGGPVSFVFKTVYADH
jgi:hypothetical protein